MKMVFALTAVIALLGMGCAAHAVVTECVSVNSSGVPGNSVSVAGNASADGRFVVLMSSADNLVANDTNGWPDVFVFDRQTGITERVSVATGGPGAQANGPSCSSIPETTDYNEFAAMSADGRYVVFSSHASNLVAGDTNGVPDVFVRDRVNHTTVRISVSSAGTEANGTSYFSSISADGSRVAFISIATNLVANDTNAAPDVFVRDIPTEKTYRVNLSSAPSNAEATGQHVNSGHTVPDCDITAWISGDGNHVAIVSGASSLVPGDTNGTYDVFVRDLNASDLGSGITERVSVSTSGEQGNGFPWAHCNYISHDGSIVTFSSKATNMVPGDTNGVTDVFVRDRNAGTTTRVSVPAGGGQFSDVSSDPACSADGSTIGINMWSAGGAYIVNRDGTGIQQIGIDSTGLTLPGGTVFPIPSSDGRYVSFVSFSSMDDLSTAQAFMVDRQAVTVADAKTKADDSQTQVTVSGGFVTAMCDGGFYLQQDGIASSGRASGIRVVWPGWASPGKRYVVTGTMNTDPTSGERQLIATTVVPHTSEWTVTAKPLGLTSKSLGGGDWRHDSGTGAGQQGVTGGVGLNNIGLLVRVTGRVTAVEPGQSDNTLSFWIEDGSGVGVGDNQGVRVTQSPPLDLQVGDSVHVTGVSSCYKDPDGTLWPSLKMVSVEPVFPARPYFIGGLNANGPDFLILFTPVRGAADYRLYESFDGTNYALRPETSSALSDQFWQIPFSIPTNRYLRVVPVNSDGVEGTPSHTVIARVQDARIPLTITSPTWDETGVSRTPTISWNSIPGAEWALASISTESAQGPTVWTTIALFPTTVVTYGNYGGAYLMRPVAGPLEPNTKHWVYVAAFDSGRWGMTSGEDVPFTTGP